MKKILSVLTLGATVLAFSGSALAAKPVTPETVDGVKVVDTAFVKANMGKMKIYDTRKKAEYVDGHLPTATHAYYKEKSKKSAAFDSSKDKPKTKKITQNKSDAIIFYCNGPRCWKSFKFSVVAQRMGYTNVHWYRDGYPAWIKAGNPKE